MYSSNSFFCYPVKQSEQDIGTKHTSIAAPMRDAPLATGFSTLCFPILQNAIALHNGHVVYDEQVSMLVLAFTSN